MLDDEKKINFLEKFPLVYKVVKNVDNNRITLTM